MKKLTYDDLFEIIEDNRDAENILGWWLSVKVTSQF